MINLLIKPCDREFIILSFTAFIITPSDDYYHTHRYANMQLKYFNTHTPIRRTIYACVYIICSSYTLSAMMHYNAVMR